jgi:hypothetical protein
MADEARVDCKAAPAPYMTESSLALRRKMA